MGEALFNRELVPLWGQNCNVWGSSLSVWISSGDWVIFYLGGWLIFLCQWMVSILVSFGGILVTCIREAERLDG